MVEAEATLVNDRPDGGHQWVVTIHHKGDSEDFDYFTGSAITAEPTADDVLYALFLDASLLEEVEDHWQLAEYLGVTPSRVTEATYNQIKVNTELLHNLLGDDYDDVERERIEGLNLYMVHRWYASLWALSKLAPKSVTRVRNRAGR